MLVRREEVLPGSGRRAIMTRDEALMRVRERAGGDLSRVPGPVIMRAVEMLMLSGEEDER